MKKTVALVLGVGFVVLLWAFESQRGAAAQDETQDESAVDRVIDSHARQFLTQGRQIFRFDTFGDEAFWGDCKSFKLHLREVGRGGGVEPTFKAQETTRW